MTKGQIILARTEIGSEKSLDGFEVRRDVRLNVSSATGHSFKNCSVIDRGWMEEQDKG